MPDAEISKIDAKAELALILEAGKEAGRIAMGFFRQAPEVWYKNEGTSPVSAADMAVDAFLKDILLGARPGYGWLSEETFDRADRLTHETVFVVDPIDGTRAFIENNTTWCVSIAVVRAGLPIAAVLVAPALDEVFQADAEGHSLKNGKPIIAAVPASHAPLRFAAPQRLVEGLSERLGREVTRMPHVPSLAYRLAMIADGRLDATLVNPKARDWDIAAADLILSNVGGRLMTLRSEPIVYNRAETDHGILVAGAASLMPQLADVVATLHGTPAQH